MKSKIRLRNHLKNSRKKTNFIKSGGAVNNIIQESLLNDIKYDWKKY